jgi:Beta-propeller repeat/Abnormal spindle-like microcephaly-assoc'd, ASPM-SPD-2-Hydin
MVGLLRVDSLGNIYIAGVNSDQTFPVTSGSVQPNDGGFVSKIDPTGSTLIYSAVFPAQPIYAGIAVHNGVAYVAARAEPGFPTTSGVFQPTTPPTVECPIVFALNSAGDGFVYATYLGGSSGQDIAHSIAVDNSGNAYVTGTTESNDFPTMNPLQPASAGGIDGFVSKINPLGTALVYSTYLGGNGQDELESISLDGAGNAYVAGWTDSTNFPVENAFQSTLNAGAQLSNAIVAALNSTGSSLIYSTYFGGMSVFGAGIATDSTGNATIVGFTTCDLPLKNPLQSTCSVNDTGFVAKFDSAGGLDFSTYFGGTSAAQPSSVALDGSGNIYFAGTVTGTASLPLVDPIELHGPPYNGGFIAEIDGTGASVLLSTYFGLPAGTPMGIGLDSSGNIYVAGETGQGLPIVNALDPVFLSKLPIPAVFVAKISPANAPAAAFAPAAIAFGNQLVGTTSSSTGVTLSDLGSAMLGVTSITTTGDFQQTNDCGSSVPAGASCTISVTFAPTVAGPRSGSVIVTDNAAGSPQTVVLTANGGVPAASLSPTSLSFSNVPVNGTSSSQTVTVTNGGTADLIISQISVTGAFSESNNCGVDLPYAGELGSVGTCQINATFAPTVSGPLSGTLSITDNAPGSPQTVALSGNSSPPGFSISPNSGSSAATVTAGQTANYNLTLTGSNGFSGQVQMTCAGAPVNATCLVSPNPVTVSGSSSAFTVAVSTQARKANVLFWPHRVMNTNFLPIVAPGLLLGVLLFMFPLRTSSSYGVWSRVRLAVLFSCLAWGAIGCGSNNGNSSTTGTPEGTYMITVSGQSGSVTQSVQLTLVVN